jgi:hypothetical protein
MRNAALLTACAIALSTLFGRPVCGGVSGGVAEPQCSCGPTCPTKSGKYVFASGKSTMTMASGWTGLRRVYSIEGWFLLKVDSAGGTARFGRVEANLVDPAGVQSDRSLDEQFDLTGLAGTVLDDGSIQFEGEVDGASSISITLVCKADGVHLTGRTTPPPGSADFPIFTLDAVAVCQCPCESCLTRSSEYVFTSGVSTVTQTGGIAGIRRTYSIVGSFQLSVDPIAGAASFARVDANLVDEKGEVWSHDLNHVFNLTELAGVVADGGKSVRFEGEADDGSSVLITLTFTDGTATLEGGTTPPPNSADFFIFALDATAQRKYAGGSGTLDDPYQIATAADLIALGNAPADYDRQFVLVGDIDLDPNLPGRKIFDKALIAPDTNAVEDDFQGTPFTGVFDGQGHTISNFRLLSPASDYAALFGDVCGEIKDLRLTDPNVAGANCVGSLAGELEEGTIAHCHVEKASVIGGEEVGALAGSSYQGIVIDSRADGVVEGDECVGGILGGNDEATVANCGAAGTVRGRSVAAGGLVGTNRGAIQNCCADSAVEGEENVGGLVGENGWGGEIDNCRSSGAVTGRDGVGGLVGSIEDGTVTNCYSASAVVGQTLSAGGLVGENDHEDAVVNCFWDISTSGQMTSAGGAGKTTAEMLKMSTFLAAGWDFVGETGNGTQDIWWIFDGRDYPRLSWERVLEDEFDDCRAEPLWMSYELEPELVQLLELDGRLEVEAVAQPEDVDAIYAANGWRLDVTKDFALRVDFHFSKRGVGDGRVTLGVVPGLDPSGMRWAEFEAGCFDTDPFYLYEVRDGLWVQERVANRSSNDGTLYMSYNPDTDELYFSRTGYGKANAWQTVPGLLKGRWAADGVYIILSGGSEGMPLDPADAWLDNLIINAGAILRQE